RTSRPRRPGAEGSPGHRSRGVPDVQVVVVVRVLGGQTLVDQNRVVEEDQHDLSGRGGPDALDEGTGGRPVVGGRLPGDPAGRALRRVGADGPDVHVDAEPVAGVAGDGPAMLEADVTERYLAVAGGGERGDRRFQLTDR